MRGKKTPTSMGSKKLAPQLDTRPGGSFEERYAAGKALRDKSPRKSHGAWVPQRGRPDPIDLLIASSEGRLENLVPIRYGRMLQSPFTFFRGAAAIMASDLSTTPVSGLVVQACGDCHLLNFGGFATPERRLIGDINDFDETLPGPWEWDLKRLAASFVIAGRNNGCDKVECREMALAVSETYREQMTLLGTWRAIDIWYERMDFEQLVQQVKDKKMRKLHLGLIEKARARSVPEHDFPKLTEKIEGRHRIKDDPPLVYHPEAASERIVSRRFLKAVADYRDSLPEDRRVLFDRYTIQDMALKVVGVGSVGTRCAMVLLMANDGDPLFLQVKEARVAVFEPYVGRSPYANRGQRVVVGQRIMQSASDLLLGWAIDEEGNHFYVRQLRDMKVKPMVEVMRAPNLVNYGKLCAQALSRAHARSGDAVRLAGYMGKSGAFDEGIADFSIAYADQNEKDHEALKRAVRDGKVEAVFEGTT